MAKSALVKKQEILIYQHEHLHNILRCLCQMHNGLGLRIKVMGSGLLDNCLNLEFENLDTSWQVLNFMNLIWDAYYGLAFWIKENNPTGFGFLNMCI